MNLKVCDTADEMGIIAAKAIAAKLNEAIRLRGKARVVLSTGASQFEMFRALVSEPVEWDKVEMFHLDEYVALPITHPASFRKYLTERFVNKVHPGAVHFVNTEGNIQEAISKITAELWKEPVDLGVIGIGENGHIAFNDPPADFRTEEAYIVVNLDDKCKHQQVREGWFATEDDVPKQAISMTVHQIMMCRSIISVVPHQVKAWAVHETLTRPVCPELPATMMKMHPDWSLFLDAESAAQIKY